MRHDAFLTAFEQTFHERGWVFKLEIRHEEWALLHDLSELKRTRFPCFPFLTNILVSFFVAHFFKGHYSRETLLFNSQVEVFKVLLRSSESWFLGVMSIQSVFNVFLDIDSF